MSNSVWIALIGLIGSASFGIGSLLIETTNYGHLILIAIGACLVGLAAGVSR